MPHPRDVLVLVAKVGNHESEPVSIVQILKARNKESPMPHIDLPEGFPGISAAFTYRPETAKPMRQLAHILLHEPNSLTPGERELIAA